jgi:hypothetical protein
MENNPGREYICHGRSAGPDPVILRAGVLTLSYSQGTLRYIKAGKNEILRMIYPALRDSNWNTLKPEITDEKITDNGSSFSVTLTCRYTLNEIDFSANYIITGTDDNTVTFEMSGEALSTFYRNRIGLCVLHPINGCVGKTCVVLHSDGTSSQKTFPEEISPHQVFKNIVAMNWPAAHGHCMLTFAGDVFETEDQRNWSDFSFKTYSTPLSIPYPAKVEKGTVINQKVTFRAENILIENGTEEDVSNIEIFHDETKRLPMIGIGRSSSKEVLSEAEIRILRPLRFDHYRIEIPVFSDGWEATASTAAREAGMLSYRAELALFFSDNYETEAENFIKWARSTEINISCAHIFHKDHPSTPDGMANFVIPFLMENIPGIRTGTGTNANFAQLNRNRPGDDYAAITIFSLHPQEHASDNLTIVENLSAQSHVAESAASIANERQLWISPVTLQRRYNANSSFYHGHTGPEGIDARMMSLLGACWTAISLKYICESETAGVTYFETVGEKGIIQGENGSQWPETFPARRGTIFPVYFVFKYLLKYKNLKIVKSRSSDPFKVDSIVLSDGKQVRMIVVNFTGTNQRVALKGCKGVMKVLTFNCSNYQEAAMNHHWNCENGESASQSARPLNLHPYSITFIEGWMKQ